MYDGWNYAPGLHCSRQLGIPEFDANIMDVISVFGDAIASVWAWICTIYDYHAKDSIICHIHSRVERKLVLSEIVEECVQIYKY